MMSGLLGRVLRRGRIVSSETLFEWFDRVVRNVSSETLIERVEYFECFHPKHGWIERFHFFEWSTSET